MSVEFIYPEFEVIRNESKCIACRVCERQCANEVHSYNVLLMCRIITIANYSLMVKK